MKIFFTKEKQWLEKWDEFVYHDEKGSHLMVSDWLQSYESYGFDFEVCICLENEKIIGGFGAVIAKMAFFKFYIVPHGPIIFDRKQLEFEQLIKMVIKRAKELKTCYCQISLPFYNAHKDVQVYNIIEKNQFKKGNKFKYVFSFVGVNWLDLKLYNSTDEILLDFKSSVRRDIRSAGRKEIKISYARDINEVKLAYDLCLENARKANYAIRDWKDFKKTILALIEKGSGKFILGIKDNEVKGAIFLIKSGGYYSYILGGTKKEKPDLLVGHLLQWEAIKLSFYENCEGYNLSLGGSKGVVEFKNGFNTKQIMCADLKYHLVLNSLLFSLYIFLEKYLKPYKSKISKILVFIKRK